VPGLLEDLRLEMALFPFKALNLGVGQEIDVQVPADLDQLGGNDSHGAFIGGEGFVQLGHSASDGGALLQQVHIVAGIGQVQSGLNAGDSTTDHQNRPDGPVANLVSHQNSS
jgi:hypothetical protein